ncbi:hypothetical protein [Marinococcus luteus]|uniref:hypothetical protein n=1 Tax=Marinococcus luteus TaxID=1122204 RepID=UPI002ACC8CCC|nr:hypothetical protein [Marinococcus luteus]MDZ5784206.1 hypothetical protein [Marinococcus luteus]
MRNTFIAAQVRSDRWEDIGSLFRDSAIVNFEQAKKRKEGLLIPFFYDEYMMWKPETYELLEELQGRPVHIEELASCRLTGFRHELVLSITDWEITPEGIMARQYQNHEKTTPNVQLI